MPCPDKNFEMLKILVTTKFRDRVVNYAPTVREFVVNSSGRCGGMRASAWQCAPCHDCQELPRIVHEQLTSCSRVFLNMFTSSSRTVQEQFTTTARQWRSRRCEDIYRASWKLLAIPEIASKETNYITETTSRFKQSRHEEELSEESQKPTGQRQRPLRDILPPNHSYQVSMLSRRHSMIHSKARDSQRVRTRLPGSRRSGSGCPRKKSLSTAGQKRPI